MLARTPPALPHPQLFSPESVAGWPLAGLRSLLEEFWRNKSGVSSLKRQSPSQTCQICSQGASHTRRGQHPNTFSSALARDCIPPRQISLPILAWAARSSRVAPVGRDLVVVALVSLFFFFFTLGYLCPSAHTQVIGTRQLPQTLLPGKVLSNAALLKELQSACPCVWRRSVLTSPASLSPLLPKNAHVSFITISIPGVEILFGYCFCDQVDRCGGVGQTADA